MTIWTEEALKRASALWKDGATSAEIAAHIEGATRSAVTGVAMRRRDLFPARPRRAGRAVTPFNTPRPARGSRAAKAQPQTAPAPERAVNSAAESRSAESRNNAVASDRDLEAPGPKTRVAFARTRRGECRHPVSGEPGPAMICCGAPVVDAAAVPGDRRASHCAFHLAISRGTGTPSERGAERELKRMAAADRLAGQGRETADA